VGGCEYVWKGLSSAEFGSSIGGAGLGEMGGWARFGSRGRGTWGLRLDHYQLN